jgi:hypothetical protein
MLQQHVDDNRLAVCGCGGQRRLTCLGLEARGVRRSVGLLDGVLG